jgi:hypothetical protein
MPLIESVASNLIFLKLDAAQNYGDAGPEQIADAQSQLRTIADAFAKCIPHLVAGTVSTTINATVTGAAPSPPTAGAVAGSGVGAVGGLVQGDAGASIGLAGAVVAVLVAGMTPLPGADLVRARLQLDVLANACAEFATYVMTNAVVNTTDVGVANTLGVNGATVGSGSGNIT